MKKLGRDSPNFRDRILLAGSLVHPDIIHQHSLRENCSGVWISRPVASRRNVQQEKTGEKRMSEYRQDEDLSSRASHVEVVVDLEANGVRFPLNGENTKIPF